MKTIQLLSLCVLSVVGLFISPVALAHPEHSSVLQTIFGENLSHWLIAHQGAITVGALMLLVVIVHHVVARMKG